MPSHREMMRLLLVAIFTFTFGLLYRSPTLPSSSPTTFSSTSTSTSTNSQKLLVVGYRDRQGIGAVLNGVKIPVALAGMMKRELHIAPLGEGEHGYDAAILLSDKNKFTCGSVCQFSHDEAEAWNCVNDDCTTLKDHYRTCDCLVYVYAKSSTSTDACHLKQTAPVLLRNLCGGKVKRRDGLAIYVRWGDVAVEDMAEITHRTIDPKVVNSFVALAQPKKNPVIYSETLSEVYLKKLNFKYEVAPEMDVTEVICELAGYDNVISKQGSLMAIVAALWKGEGKFYSEDVKNCRFTSSGIEVTGLN